jgi:hypothetical protein
VFALTPYSCVLSGEATNTNFIFFGLTVLSSSVIDRGFISGVMVNMLSSSVVDHGFISGVMVNILSSSVIDRGFIGHYTTDEPMIYPT